MTDSAEASTAKSIYRFTLLAFIVFKAICIVSFGFQYTDSDQTVMWQAAMDMSRGDFHNLFWYGQTYSSNLESLLAVPLLWLKVPVYLALPIVSGFLSLMPIVLFADIAARNGRFIGAILVLLFSVAFPVEHWQTAMLSRGFIQGIACVSLGIYVIYRTRMSVMFSLAGLLIAGGIWQNPNAVFLLCAIPLTLHRFRPLSRITITLSGAVAATLMWFALRALAIRHMDYIVHPEPALEWTFQQVGYQINNLAGFISHTLPSGITAIFILFLYLYIIPKNFKIYATIFFIFSLFIFILGFNKTADYSNNIFFGPGRFILSLPYILLFILSFTEINTYKINDKIIKSLIFVLFVFISYDFLGKCNFQFMCREYAPVFAEKTTELNKNCKEIKRVTIENQVEFILMGDHYMVETITCGCSGFIEDFPVALRPKYERRGWLWAKYGNQIPGKVLFLDSHLPEDSIQKSFSFEKVNVRGNGYILKTGNLSNKEIMQRLFPAEHFH
jgi:hypothetical protein